MRSFSSLIIAGGASKCLAAVGCIKYLEEKKQLQFIRNFVGTSAGSILCFFLCLGYTTNEIIVFLMECFDDPSITHLDPNEILGLLSNFGINSGGIIVRLLERILYDKKSISDINFIDFAKMTGKNLVVCVANLSKEREEFFCVDTTPDLSIVTAIRVSCSIPLVFTPISINDDVYVDGGIYNNFPIEYFDTRLVRDVFGINIVCTNYQKTSNFLEYTRFLIYSVIEKLNRKNINDLDRNIVTLEFDGDEPIISTSNLKINLTKEQIENYVDFGYDKIRNILDAKH